MSRERQLGLSLIGIAAGVAVLLGLLAPVASAARPQEGWAPSADGYLSFSVGLEIYDQAVWQYKLQGECDIYSGTGQHTISADVEPRWGSDWQAWLPVKKVRKKGWVPVRPRPNGLLVGQDILGPNPEQTASARYNLNSTRSIDPTSNTGDCAPNTCPDCSSSEPPREECGTKTGTAQISILQSSITEDARRAIFLMDDFGWTPENPFQTATTYCEEGGFWHWQPDWPGFETTADGGPYLKIETSRLLGFLRKLNGKERLRCNLAVSKPRPKACFGADYSRRSKVVQVRDVNEPGNREYIQQTHTLNLIFRFEAFGKFLDNGQICFPRPGKLC